MKNFEIIKTLTVHTLRNFLHPCRKIVVDYKLDVEDMSDIDKDILEYSSKHTYEVKDEKDKA